MPKRTAVSHITINVSDMIVSRRFYGKVLGELGFEEVRATRKSIGYSNGAMGVWLHPAKGPKPAREWIGIEHVAFGASSRRAVDRMQELLDGEGYETLYRAAAHPKFHKDYYSVSFKDPDGNILELVYPQGL